jgi:hypothetical protein
MSETYLSIDEDQHSAQEADHNSGGDGKGAGGLDTKRHYSSAVTNEEKAKEDKGGGTQDLQDEISSFSIGSIQKPKISFVKCIQNITRTNLNSFITK